MKVIPLAHRRELAERAKYGVLVLSAWDKQNTEGKQAKRVGKPSTLDTNPEIRRKAKAQL